MERPPHQPIPENDGSLPTKKESPREIWELPPDIQPEDDDLLNSLGDWPKETISPTPGPDNDEKQD